MGNIRIICKPGPLKQPISCKRLPPTPKPVSTGKNQIQVTNLIVWNNISDPKDQVVVVQRFAGVVLLAASEAIMTGRLTEVWAINEKSFDSLYKREH